MSCKYTYQGKTYTAWEFADLLASMPADELAAHLPAGDALMKSAEELPDEISVDGLVRPTKNSRGQPIYPTLGGIKNFWRWFGGSLIADDGGRPMVMYHGTDRDFDAFDPMKSVEWRRVVTMDVIGSWFSDNPVKVDDYSGQDGKQVMPVYLSISRPKYFDTFSEFLQAAHEANGTKYDPRSAPGLVNPLPLKERLVAQGYDGIVFARTENGELAERIRVQRERQKQAKEGLWAAQKAGDKKDAAFYQRIIDESERIIKEARHIIGDDLSTEFDNQFVHVAFEPGQIKSAIGNDGEFSQDSPGISASISFDPRKYIKPDYVVDRLRGSESAIANKVANAIEDAFGPTEKTFNWWHRTVGSQFHKARVNRAFGRVFDRAQRYLEDVSRYAAQGADRAPGLIPKMDSIRDAFAEVWNSRRDSADQKAIAAPIYEGTLYTNEKGEVVGRVWSEDELRDQFKLNDRQIELYKQFRHAVDSSLEQLAVSEMNKVARANELEMPGGDMPMRALADFYGRQYEEVLKEKEARFDELVKVHAANLEQLKLNAEKLGKSREEYAKAKAGMEQEQAAEHLKLFREIEELRVLDKGIRGKAKTIMQLQAEGYAPLMRFGRYTVDVVQKVPLLDDNGEPMMDADTGEMLETDERVLFSMFDSEREAREAARILEDEYPGATVSRGVASEDGYQLFGAVHPGSLEALMKLVDNEDEVMQRFYKEAVSSRSALKRLIHRQGTAGYSQDVVRSLSSFLLSNARAAASTDHMGDMVKAISEIDKTKGDVMDEAIALANYVRNPNEEAGTLRGLLFMQYLGGSIASAMVNLTQTATTTAPFLSQFGGTISELVSAGKLAAKRMSGKSLDAEDFDLGRALAQAEDAGIVAPHNIHVMMGQSGAQSATQNKYVRMASHIWGSFFGMAEQFNRETAFIAAYRLARNLGRQGMADLYAKQKEVYASRGLPTPDPQHFSSPFAFAANAVNETQFVLSKAARPNWARGTVGATLFVFKQYSVMWMELFKRLPTKERAIMLGVLVLLSGLGGLPFDDDLDDLIDTLGQMAGYNTNTNKWKERLVADTFGKEGGDFVMHGVSAFLPLDIANRLGMNNLVPATGLLKKSSSGNHDRDIAELGGAAGGYLKQLMDAWDYTLKGDYVMAATQGFAPKAIKDLAKGIDMAATGVYEDTRGRRVTDVSTLDALIKAIGFQPTAVSEIQRKKGQEMQDVALVKSVKAAISEVWASGIHDKDPETTARARSMLAEWNEKNPETPINIERSAVMRRAKQMGMTATERFIKTAPKEMRSTVKDSMEG